MSERPTRQWLHMQTAFDWAQRSLCSLPDRKVGAVITTEDLRTILSIGYNGPGKGLPNDFCQMWRELDKPLGGLSRCPCLHAEDNAIAFVDGSLPNKVIFTTMSPCLICAQRAINANIRTWYYADVYRDTSPLSILGSAGVLTIKLGESKNFQR